MDFDFHEQYKNYSTAELLEITKHPEKYQPAALAAASEILATRELPPVVLEQPHTHIYAHKETDEISIFDDIEPHPASKWPLIILVLLSLQYLHLLYTRIIATYNLISSGSVQFKGAFMLSYIDLLFLPFLYVMFYQRKRWAWIAVFGVKLLTISSTLIYYFRDYLTLDGASIFPLFMFITFLSIAIVVLLWMPEVTREFKLSKKAKVQTLAIVAFIFVLEALLSSSARSAFQSSRSVGSIYRQRYIMQTSPISPIFAAVYG